MNDLESKSTTELIELIEELQEDIEEKEQAIEELQEETADLTVENEQHEDVDVESIAELAFRAGYNDKYVIGTLLDNDMELTKAWLNYKIGARI